MGKSEKRVPREPRRRQLNVIYFVDSSRTRSFTVPLARLNVVLFLVLGAMTWSVFSTGILAWVVQGNVELRSRLRGTLAKVFEYESRYEDVFGVAYPTDKPATDPAPPSVAGLYDSGKPAVSTATSAEVAAAEAVSQPVAGAAPVEANSLVVVGNPVLEKGADALILHFDLTNKSAEERVEGYLWAIAEFVSDQGEKVFIGAPLEIAVTPAGEPGSLERSANFNIRRYKKKSFSFPYVKDRVGTFTGVRIGVMDRSQGRRTTYKVPVEIRVGATGAAPVEQPEDGSKSG